MKKRIFLAWIFSFMPYMGEARQAQGEADVSAQAPAYSVTLVDQSNNIQSVEGVLCMEDENNSENCEKIKICKIYNALKTKEECMHLPYSVVQSLEKVHNIIGSANVVNLRQMDRYAFSMYVNLDIDPLIEQIEEYSIRDVKQFLAWLGHPSFDLQNSSGGKIPPLYEVFDADQNFEVLKRLLMMLVASNFEDYKKKNPVPLPYEYALKQPIYEYTDEKGKNHQYTVFDLIAKSNNEAAGEWIHSFIEEECFQETLCILQTYGALSEVMSDEVADKLSDFYYFEGLLNKAKAITEGSNKIKLRPAGFQIL